MVEMEENRGTEHTYVEFQKLFSQIQHMCKET